MTGYYPQPGNAKYRQLGNVLTFADTGLTAGTKYTYKVYAFDRLRELEWPVRERHCDRALTRGSSLANVRMFVGSQSFVRIKSALRPRC